ncbi:MAG: GNAT family N-acetyltransferase [Bacilli bacterium]|nr:GNAT family N-acetyltransferase [Bacilli bacterium]
MSIDVNKIYLKIPTLEEYWYEQKVLSDPLTMQYNAGWEVSYDGYDYDTGCIDFPENKWEKDYNRRLEKNRFFAYIIKKETEEFIGYVNFHYNITQDRYDCGIVIEHAFRGKGYAKDALIELCLTAFFDYKIDKIYDSFEEDREALILFEKIGFKVVNKYKSIRFKKEVDGIDVCLTKTDFLNYLENNYE